jgi:sugar (pentulose or hexulose) kinase
VTGGGSRLGPLVQILADVLDRELLLSASPDAAGIGAARIAALAIDPSLRAGAQASPTVVAPRQDGVARLAELRRRYDDAARSVRELATR